MSWCDYEQSRLIWLADPPFYALIMAAMRGADTHSLDKLRVAFPHVWDELSARYNAIATDGVLPSDGWIYELSMEPDD